MTALTLEFANNRLLSVPYPHRDSYVGRQTPNPSTPQTPNVKGIPLFRDDTKA
jgi:hypothetical protein